MWKTSKDSYRKRYYENEDPFESTETRFGKKIADELEADDRVVGSETSFDVELIPGLRLIGRLDSFDEDTLEIIEYKTGHMTAKGQIPWNNVKVRKHGQLVFYPILVLLKYGKFNPVVKLKWLETKFKDNTVEFDGHVLKGKTKELELTGREETFIRTIADYEIDKMKEDIIRVAEEISNDYTEYEKDRNTKNNINAHGENGEVISPEVTEN
jgi:hypothetical protein